MNLNDFIEFLPSLVRGTLNVFSGTACDEVRRAVYDGIWGVVKGFTRYDEAKEIWRNNTIPLWYYELWVIGNNSNRIRPYYWPCASHSNTLPHQLNDTTSVALAMEIAWRRQTKIHENINNSKSIKGTNKISRKTIWDAGCLFDTCLVSFRHWAKKTKIYQYAAASSQKNTRHMGNGHWTLTHLQTREKKNMEDDRNTVKQITKFEMASYIAIVCTRCASVLYAWGANCQHKPKKCLRNQPRTVEQILVRDNCCTQQHSNQAFASKKQKNKKLPTKPGTQRAKANALARIFISIAPNVRIYLVLAPKSLRLRHCRLQRVRLIHTHTHTAQNGCKRTDSVCCCCKSPFLVCSRKKEHISICIGRETWREPKKKKTAKEISKRRRRRSSRRKKSIYTQTHTTTSALNKFNESFVFGFCWKDAYGKWWCQPHMLRCQWAKDCCVGAACLCRLTMLSFSLSLSSGWSIVQPKNI